MQTQAAVPSTPDATPTNPDQAPTDQSNKDGVGGVAAQQQHVSHGDSAGKCEPVPADN